MKQRMLNLIIVLLTAVSMSAQVTVSGMVSDGHEPLVGANVFILGTIDGCLTDASGRFSFTTTAQGNVTLKATYIGFEDFMLAAEVGDMHDITITMRFHAASIDEVVVLASTYSFGKSDNFKTMDAHGVVMSGNSCGDIIGALQSLPGTQKVGEDGKLYVRGGESNECQTFINGMHVLSPYSTNVEGQAQRGRFSPFLFKGINFSLGGYGGEYGQALSSVLPMETTDVQTSDKVGVSASLVDWNIGGTKAFPRSSLSFNAAYTDMGVYNRLFTDHADWTRPYRKLSTEAQYKVDLSSASMLKSYFGYDLTSVGQHIDDRRLSLVEHNIYANVTMKSNIGRGYSLFAGIANSTLLSNIGDALTLGDRYHNWRNEIHLKMDIRKVFSPSLKMSAGVEDYYRHSEMTYSPYQYNLDHNILAAHIDAQWRLVPRLFLHLSTRAEQSSYNNELALLPRFTLSYIPNQRFQTSIMFGRYSQAAEDDYLARCDKPLSQGIAYHAIFSMQYKNDRLMLRVEPYWKKYRHLPLLAKEQGSTENPFKGLYRSEGYGTSRGVDAFVEYAPANPRLPSLSLAYSYNDSERLYLDYATLRMPYYASRHNLRLSAKYTIGKAIIGVTESYASRRQFSMGKSPHYNSVDLNVTYLLHPKVIVYASLSNVFGRNNIFGYRPDGSSITATRNRFFYIGIFVSLKNNKAYDISNF